jgi:hypothetical protein
MQGKSTIGPEEQQEAWAKMLTAIDPSRGSFGGPRFASSLVPIPELQRRAARSRRAAAEELSCGDPCSRTGLHGIVPTESRGVENRATTRHGRDHGRPPAVLAIAPQPCPIRERHTRPRATAVVEIGQPAIGISWDVTGHFGGRERSLPGRTLGAAWVPRQGKPSGDGARASCWPDSLCFRHTIPMCVFARLEVVLPAEDRGGHPRNVVAVERRGYSGDAVPSSRRLSIHTGVVDGPSERRYPAGRESGPLRPARVSGGSHLRRIPANTDREDADPGVVWMRSK